MARDFKTNGDKILKVVLSQKKLVEYGKYKPEDYPTIGGALNSDNPIVQTVARLIDGKEANCSDSELYAKIHNFLASNL